MTREEMMKYPEYDSPFEVIMTDVIHRVANREAQQIDDMCWQEIQKVGVYVDKEKLLAALKQDAECYREAYTKGHETGYTKRDEEIIRCENCRHWDRGYTDECENPDSLCYHNGFCKPDWSCAGGERKDDD